MLTIYLVFFVASGLIQRTIEREKKDPEYSKKMDKWREKWMPKLDFIENLFIWIFGLAVIYFVFLGGLF